jgi:hypothetical protein
VKLVAAHPMIRDSALWGLTAREVYRCAVAATLLTLAVLTAIELALSAVMLVYPGELMYGESILYDHARRVLEGAPLYQPIDQLPYTVASYTPLFYWLAAGSQWLFGAGLAPGRALALIALLAATALVGCLAAAEGRGVRTGVVASLVFLALGAPGSGGIPWTALYKEDNLSLALALGSLLVLARGPRVPLAIGGAGLLAALAILTKQTYAAIVLAEAAWIGWRQRRLAAVFVLCAFGPVVALAAVLEATTGAFIASTVFANLNPLRMDWLSSNLMLLALFQAGPVLAGVIGLLSGNRRTAGFQSLLLLGWAGGAVQALAIAKLGGASNHWLAFAAVGAVLAARAIVPKAELSRPHVSHWLAAAAFAVGLSAVAPIASTTWLSSGHTLFSSTESRRQMDQLVERTRASSDLVLADPVDVLVLAGKHPLFEPLLLSTFVADGRWDVRPLVDSVCTQRLGLVVVDRPISQLDWPAPLREAVDGTMRLQGELAGRLVYVPRASRSGGVCH